MWSKVWHATPQEITVHPEAKPSTRAFEVCGSFHTDLRLAYNTSYSTKRAFYRFNQFIVYDGASNARKPGPQRECRAKDV